MDNKIGQEEVGLAALLPNENSEEEQGQSNQLYDDVNFGSFQNGRHDNRQNRTKGGDHSGCLLKHTKI
jgi:hypothetical protein